MSFKDPPLLSVSLSYPLAPILNAPWFSSEMLVRYKSLDCFFYFSVGLFCWALLCWRFSAKCGSCPIIWVSPVLSFAFLQAVWSGPWSSQPGSSQATYRLLPIIRWSKCGGNDMVMVLLGSGTSKVPKEPQPNWHYSFISLDLYLRSVFFPFVTSIFLPLNKLLFDVGKFWCLSPLYDSDHFAHFLTVGLTWNFCWFCRWRHVRILASNLMRAVLAHYRLECIVLHIIISYHTIIRISDLIRRLCRAHIA